MLSFVQWYSWYKSSSKYVGPVMHILGDGWQHQTLGEDPQWERGTSSLN